MAQTHCGLAKPWFCIRRTRCEPHGARTVWVGEAEVLHSENGMRTLWCTRLILRWRNLGFAVLNRDANPMVSTHSGLATLRFCPPRARGGPYGATCVLHCQTGRRTHMRTLMLV